MTELIIYFSKYLDIDNYLSIEIRSKYKKLEVAILVILVLMISAFLALLKTDISKRTLLNIEYVFISSFIALIIFSIYRFNKLIYMVFAEKNGIEYSNFFEMKLRVDQYISDDRHKKIEVFLNGYSKEEKLRILRNCKKESETKLDLFIPAFFGGCLLILVEKLASYTFNLFDVNKVAYMDILEFWLLLVIMMLCLTTIFVYITYHVKNRTFKHRIICSKIIDSYKEYIDELF